MPGGWLRRGHAGTTLGMILAWPKQTGELGGMGWGFKALKVSVEGLRLEV